MERKLINYKLKLTLDTKFLNKKELEILKKYGCANKGIIREIIVNSKTSLHQLNYMIQKCFGFYNSHLHAFSLPSNDYRALTIDSCSMYYKYLGMYFRLPTESDFDNESIFYDDDYKSGSFHKWLKEKYTGKPTFYGLYEQYPHHQYIYKDLFNPNSVVTINALGLPKHLKKDNEKKLLKDCSLIELEYSRLPGFNELNERLLLDQVLYFAKSDYEVNYYDIEEDADTLHDRFNENEYIKYYNKYYDKIKVDDDYLKYAKKFDIDIKPITNKLIYRYDFGDNWKIIIQIVDVYTKDGDNVLDFEGNVLKDNLLEKNLKAFNFIPQGVSADGLNVVEDVGGIKGFVDFLERIHNNDDEDNLADWAKFQSWKCNKPNGGCLL